MLILLAAITVKVLWWTVEPLIPLAIVGIGLIFVYSWIFRRRW